MKLRPVSLAVLALLSGLALQAAADEARHTYIVRLADAPAATYSGGVNGLPATRPAPGARLDVSASDVQAYLSYLEQKQSSVAATVPAAEIIHQYTLVLNGFAARLTDAEVRALKKNAAVAGITADEPLSLDTNYTPTFLGLDQPGTGLWDKLGGKIAAGENVVIGVVDSGIWPENPAYADRVDANGNPTFDSSGTPAYQPLAGWKGGCDTGEGFTPQHCNNKLIGARAFRAGFEAQNLVQHWTEFTSPRDSIAGAKGHGGHGTHTSTTSGGNNGVAANLSGINIGRVSGMAPRARLAAYKVCWTYVDETNPDGTGSRNSCFTSDSVAAIHQAVADGVDVINYSISGSQTSVTDPVELAFFDAAAAGVFVAASAGNSGPSNAVAHVSPWLTTVAASTHNRFNGANLTVGGATYLGASYNETPLPGTPTILAQDAAMQPFASLSTFDKQAAARCYNATDRAANNATDAAALDPSKVTGKVLLCERGVSARVDKSKAVKDAGGAGMILIDVSNTTAPIADPHSVPSVHLNFNDGAIVKAYIAANANTLSAIGKFSPQVGTTPAPKMADFSSRGPNRHNANLLKPDLTAPGVDVLAGVTADKTQAQRDAIANNIDVPEPNWASYQGTSMSSPHVAGLAALLRQAHPNWSPAAIKSALMTTAFDTFNDGQPGMANGRLPWAQGAGHVAPNKAVDPGLVYDHGPLDWIRYMCGIPGTLTASSCQNYGSVQPYNLNMPSLTASTVLGKITLTRTVTNVSDQPGNYTAQATLPGYDVVVSPSSLNLAPGAKGSFNVTLTRSSAALNAWAYGNLTWTDTNGHVVRSPLTARAASLAVPSLLTSEAASGNVSFTVGAGYTGMLGIKKGGLKPASRSANTVGVDKSSDGGVAACAAGGSAGVKVHSITVPSDSLLLRAALYDSDTSGYQAGGKDDLDLIVLNQAGTVVGSSGGSSSNEVVTVSVPAAGTYKACVVGYAPKGGTSNYTLSSWVLKNGEIGGNFKVNAPPGVVQSGTATAAASWYDLAPAKHLAAMVYTVNNVNTAITVLEVDTTDPVPEPTAQRNDAPGRF